MCVCVWSDWKDTEGAKGTYAKGFMCTTTFQHIKEEEKTLLLPVDIPMMPSILIHGQQ